MTHHVSPGRSPQPPKDELREASTGPSLAGRPRPSGPDADPPALVTRVASHSPRGGPTPEGWPGSGEAHHAADEAWLQNLLSDLRERGLPARRAPEPPAAKRRVWRPWHDADPAFPACTPMRRHPELDFSYRELAPFKVRRHRPGFGWGIKKELTSSVTGRDVFAASSLEFDAFRFLELDGTNTGYIEQPLLLRYELDGRRRWYRPDALVRRESGLECVEVKFEADAAEREAKWEAIGRGLSAIGIGFSVLTERHLRRPPLHKNVRTVFQARHARPCPYSARAALDAVRTAGAATMGELQQKVGMEFRHVCFLLRHGFLSADLEAETLADGTVVRWSGRASVDPWRPRT